MGEPIKRGLLPGVGQNPLTTWLASPRVENPINDQSTTLVLVQELIRFQRKFRIIEATLTLLGIETVASFQATVPDDEAWRVTGMWVRHDNAGDTVFAVVLSGSPLSTGNVSLSRQRVESTTARSTPLIGSLPQDVAPAPGSYTRVEPFDLLPGDQIAIASQTAMAAGDVITFNVRYELIPLPLEKKEAAAGLWIANGST